MDRVLSVHRPNGDVVEVELPAEWTCTQAAHHLAYQFGLPVFDGPWCIGLAETLGPRGPELSWMVSTSRVEDIPDDGECFLSRLPIGATQWN